MITRVHKSEQDEIVKAIEIKFPFFPFFLPSSGDPLFGGDVRSSSSSSLSLSPHPIQRKILLLLPSQR